MAFGSFNPTGGGGMPPQVMPMQGLAGGGAAPPMMPTMPQPAPPQPIDNPALSLPPMLPPAAPAILHDVKVVTKRTVKQARVMGVPPEEFGISRLAKSIRDATYCFHYQPNRTEAELVGLGYDADQVHALTTSIQPENRESIARDTVDERNPSGLAEHHANRPIATTEHYIKIDYEGRGVPKIWRVVTAGEQEQILIRDGEPDITAVDMMPFAAMTPIIVTHRFYGRSIADMVMDIQRIKTALLRGALDNIYLANNQRIELPEIAAGKNTIDDLLTNRPGGIVRTKGQGGLKPIPNEPLGPFIFPMIQYMDQTRQWRSGVNDQSKGLEADALQNQSATASNNIFRAAEANIKLIARIFAETGIRDLFSLLHATIRKNDRESNTVRLRNKWVTIDPRDWKARNDLTVNVGLGSGTKPEQIAALMQILGIQRQAIQFPQLGLVRPKNIYNSCKKLVELTGLKSVELYFDDPTEPQLDANGQPLPPPAAPPNPAMMKVQAEAQIDQLKAGAQMQIQQSKAEAQIAIATHKAQTEAQLEMMKFQLQQQQAAHKAQIDAMESRFDQALRAQDFANKQQATAAANGPMMPGSPMRPPNESINFKDLPPEAQQQMLEQAGIHIKPQQPQSDPAMIAAMNSMAEGHKALAHAMTAPRRLVKDANNEVIGAETVGAQ